MSGLSLRSSNCPSSVSSKTFSTPSRGKENVSPFSNCLSKVKKGTNDSSKSENQVDFNDISLTNTPLEMKPKVRNPLFNNKSLNEIPIPKGNTAYSKAKRAEYVERDLVKAEKYYKIAIRCNERLDSAIKDLATVLHQQGKTEEACKFLEQYRDYYHGDKVKYENLLDNLRKQIVPSGNCLNRTLALFNYPLHFVQRDIKNIFSNSSRVLKIEIKNESSLEDIPTSQNYSKLGIKLGHFCLIHFASYSAARKTLETLKDPDLYQLYWMNIYGKITGKAELIKPNALITEGDYLEIAQEKEFQEAENQTNPIYNNQEILTPNQIPKLKDEPFKDNNAFIPNEGNILQKGRAQEKAYMEAYNKHNQNPPCWQNCVLLTTNENSTKEYSAPETKTDIFQEIFLNYISFKVFENDDKKNVDSIWEKHFRRPYQKSFEPLKNTKNSLWEKIQTEERKIRARIANDFFYVDNLLRRSKETEEILSRFQHSDPEETIQTSNFLNADSNFSADFFTSIQGQQNFGNQRVQNEQLTHHYFQNNWREDNTSFNPGKQFGGYFNIGPVGNR